MPNFQDLTDVELEELSNHCKLLHIERNKVVLKPEQSLSCFVVAKGTLRVLMKQHGHFLELASLGVGNTFGGARLSQGCTKENDGIALVTGHLVKNEIIEIEPKYFFKFCIRQDNRRRNRWAKSLDVSFPFLANSFKLTKERKGNTKHLVLRPKPTSAIVKNVCRERVWRSFKDNLMEKLQEEVANGGIGASGGRIPVIFRPRSCAPGTTLTAKGRRRLTLERKRKEKEKVGDSIMLLNEATGIQTMNGGSLGDFRRKINHRVEKAGQQYSLLTQEAATAIADATNTKRVVTSSDLVSNKKVENAEKVQEIKRKEKTTTIKKKIQKKKILWWQKNKKKELLEQPQTKSTHSMTPREMGMTPREMGRSLGLASRTIGSVIMCGSPTPSRPSTNYTRNDNSDTSKNIDRSRWIPTRRTQTVKRKGHTDIVLGRWHAGFLDKDW